jgi:hypothetical protein
MRLRCCHCVCLCIPLPLLGNGLVKVPLSLLGNGSVKIPTTSCVYYEMKLLFVCVPARVHINVSFSMLSESYQRKLYVCLYIPLSLLGNGYVFYAVRVLSKESRRLVLPRCSRSK